jgi:23S rRNA G2445 N2-methylase RlmL
MKECCKSVTLLDITPKVLVNAESNVREAKLSGKIKIINGDITDLAHFLDEEFSFLM